MKLWIARGERIYNEDYSTGEYCHEQSFLWGFQEGFQFSNKKMIEKALEWIKEHTYQDCLGVSPIAKLKVGYSSVEELVNAFKQAMED